MPIVIDRILIGREAKQVFGTQFQGKIERPESFCNKDLDMLRKKIGLESMEEYAKRMEEYAKRMDF